MRLADSIEKKWTICFAVLGIGAIVVIVKTILMGSDIDEQYALTLAYRIASGDLMVKQMWEPHQTSAILPAVFVKVFLLITGSTEYLLIYMRIIKYIIYLVLSLFWIFTMKKRFSVESVILTGILILIFSSKWIVTPEFSDLQIIFLLFCTLFIINYYDYKRTAFIAIAGVMLAFDILAYPSCIILLIPYMLVLIKDDKKAAGIFFFSCAIVGMAILCYLLSYLSYDEIIFDILDILEDGTHKIGLKTKFVMYGAELISITKRVFIYILISILISAIAYIKFKDIYRVFTHVFVLVALIDQIWFWFNKSGPHVHRQIIYLVIFITGAILYINSDRNRHRLCFRLLWIPSVFSYLAVIILTNVDLKVSFSSLLPGILFTIILMIDGKDKGFNLKNVVPVLFVLVMVVAKICLVRGSAGAPYNIFDERVKSLYGATKGVYVEVDTGIKINSDYEFLMNNTESGDKLFYIGDDTCLYLLNQFEVCSASTISTPVFNKIYTEYFEVNPDKEPKIIVIDMSYLETHRDSLEYMLGWIEGNYDYDNKKTGKYYAIVKKDYENGK